MHIYYACRIAFLYIAPGHKIATVILYLHCAYSFTIEVQFCLLGSRRLAQLQRYIDSEHLLCRFNQELLRVQWPSI
jgi:hypothetical protein